MHGVPVIIEFKNDHVLKDVSTAAAGFCCSQNGLLTGIVQHVSMDLDVE